MQTTVRSASQIKSTPVAIITKRTEKNIKKLKTYLSKSGNH